jgi:hypothetical protein
MDLTIFGDATSAGLFAGMWLVLHSNGAWHPQHMPPQPVPVLFETAGPALDIWYV